MKKTISAFIAFILLFVLVFSLPVSADSEDDNNILIKIVHTNDIHARVIEDSGSGIIGISKLKSIIDDFTSDADIDLILDSGDAFHGQSIATLVQGESIARLFKECGYDAMTAGNHDWSYGKDRLKELAEIADLEMLTGNVVKEDNTGFFNTQYLTEEYTENGNTVKVGIFGVIDPKIYSSTAPSNLSGLTFTDPIAYSNSVAAALAADGCDIVIALSHTYSPAELAASVNGVDLWLCGHEHIDINTTVTTPDGSTAYVVEDGYYLGEAGLIELDCSFDESGSFTSYTFKKTTCTYTDAAVYPNDPDLDAVLSQIQAEQSVILDQKVGSSPEYLDGVWEHLRIGETNLGKAVANAYLLATGADIAFENAGGIRASINAGDVTYGDIINVSPYGNYIVTKKISGSQLKEILETSIDIQLQCIEANDSGEYDAWPSSSGSYLQSAGMTVKYDPSAEKGKRVLSVTIAGAPLVDEQTYTVATNNFAAVSSSYPQLADSPEEGEFCACDEALISFFEQNENIIAEKIAEKGMIAIEEPAEPTPQPTPTLSPSPAPTAPTETAAPSSGNSVTPSKSSGKLTAPPTADGTMLPLYFLILLSSAAVLVFTVKKSSEK